MVNVKFSYINIGLLIFLVNYLAACSSIAPSGWECKDEKAYGEYGRVTQEYTRCRKSEKEPWLVTGKYISYGRFGTEEFTQRIVEQPNERTVSEANNNYVSGKFESLKEGLYEGKDVSGKTDEKGYYKIITNNKGEYESVRVGKWYRNGTETDYGDGLK